MVFSSNNQNIQVGPIHQASILERSMSAILKSLEYLAV
jgi:hypothetical protein